MHVASCGACRDEEACRHAQGHAHHHLPTADDIVKSRADGGWDPSSNGVDDVQKKLRVDTSDSDVGNKVGQVLIRTSVKMHWSSRMYERG